MMHGRIQEVLLTALGVALAHWRAHARLPPGATLVGVEGHGREDLSDLSDRLDVSRTVGWFTSLSAVRLDAPAAHRADRIDRLGDEALARMFKHTKEQLRAVPGGGIGYGLLRYLNPSTAPVLAALPAPHVGFNYLGRMEASAARDWAAAEEMSGLGGGAKPDTPLAYAIEVNAIALDAAHGVELHAHWNWASALLDHADVRDLAESWFHALERLVRLALDGAVVTRAPVGRAARGAVAGGARSAGEGPGALGAPRAAGAGRLTRRPTARQRSLSPAWRRLVVTVKLHGRLGNNLFRYHPGTCDCRTSRARAALCRREPREDA